MRHATPISVTAARRCRPLPSHAPDQKSVAVLAFANLSDDKGSEYFSDGISEELLTVLQKIPGLHVAARTSAFSFKGKNATAQEIGQKLGVAHLVEGSVRKAGDVVRIAARLTRTDTGEQLWSENFTRDLKDVFAVANRTRPDHRRAVERSADGRRGGSGGEGGDSSPSAGGGKRRDEKCGGPSALSAGPFLSNRSSEKSAGEALAEYQRAVELDPSFALAWAGLAQTHLWYCNFPPQRTGGLRRPFGRAREAAARALAIEPTCRKRCLPARRSSSISILTGKERAKLCGALWPWLPQIRHSSPPRGPLPWPGGHDAGIELYRQAVALDPVNPQRDRVWLSTLALTGRLAEAQGEYPRVMELSPAAPWSTPVSVSPSSSR